MRVLAAALLTFALLAPAAMAQVPAADLVCATNAVPNPTREARYFCEAMDSTFFVQFDQFLAGLDHLATTYPDFIDVRTIGTSVLGRPIQFVEVTNEQSPVPRSEKLQIGYSASIHANEAAGREGMVRTVEDLVAGIGPYGAELKPSLDNIILNVWFPNPDSWAAGDFFDAASVGGLHNPAGGAGFARENANGFDLNRQFPNPGWILPEHEPMSQPEARAVVEELRYSGNHANLVASADLHGMLNSPNMIRSIIPNQDYDFRRMVLVVEQLKLMQERIEANPSFAEWNLLAGTGASFEEAIGQAGAGQCLSAPGLPQEVCLPTAEAPIDRPFLWGARWDQIGYTDTGFTSDYLTLSPRSPTGGMGAVGQIVEFAYSHMVPDNKYVAKLTDMHVSGVREIVRTQMEQAFRLTSPVLAGTGTVGYAWTDSFVSSDDDPNFFGRDKPAFDLASPEARFDFQQVPYKVSNLNFWRDLGRFSTDPFLPIEASTLTAADLEPLASFAITDQALDGFTTEGILAVTDWVRAGGHLLLTDSALRFLDRSGILPGTVKSACVYIGHSDLQDLSHPLLAGVDWNARVTGEASGTGFGATEGSASNYPAWGVEVAPWLVAKGDIVGTTQGSSGESPSCVAESTDPLVTVGRLAVGKGSIDLLGSALPRPTQAYDHRYGLTDYSVSALAYWIIMNSLGGSIEMKAIPEPFVPTYDYDPLYGVGAPFGAPATNEQPAASQSERTPSLGVAALVAVIGLALLLRRR